MHTLNNQVCLLPFLPSFALGALSLLIFLTLKDFSRLKVGKSFIALLIAGSFFLVQRYLPAPWNDIAGTISTMVPALFWLLCQLAFAFRPKVISIAGLLALYTFMAPALVKLIQLDAVEHNILHFLTWTLGSYLEYLVIGLGLWTVIKHWKDDLVETSRRLRLVVLISVGVTVLLVVIPMNTGLFSLDVSYIATSLAAYICSYYLFSGKAGVLFGLQQADATMMNAILPATITSTSQPEPSTQDPTEDKDQQKLTLLMETGFYRTEHLTIKLLAEALELPEYKTRALINQTLGYRNFNDYINQLRIQEATQRLINEPDTPVLNISLDIGYRTLSSFNRAFKEIENTTPTDYRQCHSQA